MQLGGNMTEIAAPFAVFLNKDSHNYLEPDLSICAVLPSVHRR